MKSASVVWSHATGQRIDASSIAGLARRVVPASHTQESLWLLEKISQQHQPTYHESVAFCIEGPLRVDLLCQSLRIVVERHEALRTIFAETTEGLRAIVQDRVPEFIDMVDLRDLATPDASARAAARISECYRAPFALNHGPLLRAVIVRVTDTETILALTGHHIVVDGWSQGLILGEVATHYAALCRSGRPAHLPVPGRYSDHVVAARRACERGELADKIGFWRRQLEGAPDLLALPTDRSRPAVQSFAGSTCSVTVPRHTIAALVDRCRRECGSTEFVVLLSAYATLLHRLTGQDRITIGSAMANRDDPDSSSVVGYFANTVALSFSFDDTTTFRSLVTQVAGSWCDVLRHQDAPYPKVLESLAIEHDPSHSPVFQTMMTALDRKQLDLGNGLVCRPYRIERSAAKFELLIYTSEGDQGIELEAEFNTDLFDRATVERILARYVHLLEQLAADIGVAVSRVSIVPDAERQLILDVWNDTRVDTPSGTVIDAFEAQAARTPDAVAVELGDRRWSYDELNRLTNRLAHALIAAQGRPGGFIGVYMERSIDMVAALVAIVKAGMAYVPIDPEYPADRIRYMIEDSQVSLVLTQDHHRAALTGAGCQAITLSELERGSTDESSVVRSLDFDSRVYMIYTSGSTGRPKGVINRHGSLFNRLYWMQSEYPLTADDRILQKTPFSFDVSVWEFFWPLMFGARIVVARPGGHRDADYLKHLIRDKQITTLHFVPSMLNVFLEEDELGAYCGSLRRVFCSGEALPYKAVESFYQKIPCRLHNLYGPTEAAIDVSYWECTLDYPGKVVPIGKPIANVQLYIVDKHFQLQPIGVPGELCIGGVGLAEGYHNRDDLTRKAFIADPLAREPGARMYRTGDLARYLPDGQIEYLGRIDNQVKLRGFRIELGEIEAVVQSAPGVREAAVIVHETPNHRMLVAYVVADRFDLQRTRDHLRTQLPDFMIPQIFVTIPAIPTSANGKLDRKALPDPFTAPGATGPAPAAPVATEAATPAASALLGIWRDVLGVASAGLDSNFFRLGGDSILSIRIAARLRELGYHIEVQEIFAHPTVRQLAQRLAIARRPAETGAHAPFELIDAATRQLLPPEIEDAWPLTRLQFGMIYHALMNERSAVYHDIFSYDIQAALDLAALTRAIHSVVAAHPQLRSSFDLHGYEEPLQLVHREVAVPIEVASVSALPRAAQDEAIARWCDDEKRRDFDLERAPLIRFQIHVRSPRELTLTVSFHHVILDGWSVALVVEELRRAYAALLAGRTVALEPEQARYSAYIALERRAVDDAAQAAFWQAMVGGISGPLLLGAEPVESNRRRPAPASSERVVPAAAMSALHGLTGRLGLPLKSAFLALHLHALSQITSRRDVVSGLVVNGRPEIAGAEKLVGLFLNTIPLACEPRDEDWSARIGRTFALEQDAVAHRRFPIAEILKRSGHKVLFDTIFNYTNFHVYRTGEDDAVKIVGVRYFEQTNFSVVVHAHFDQFAGRMKLAVNYDASRVDGDVIDRYLDAYLSAVGALAAEAAQPPVLSRETAAPGPSGRAAGAGRVEQIRAIVGAAIGVPSLDLDDRYFELGMDSITAIRVVGKLKRLGVGLSLQNVFEHPTVRALATSAGTVVAADEAGARTASADPIDAAARELPPGVAAAYPATALQVDMIEHGAADVAQAVYHDVFSYRLELPLDEALLRRTLDRLVAGHDALRTAFALDARPVPLQWVFARVDPYLELFDLSRLPEAAQAAAFDDWFAAERGTGFDVSRPALIRFFAHRHGPSCFTLTLSFHHAIIDGWSLSLLIRDLVGIYAAALQSGEVAAPRVPALQYRDYVRVEHESRGSSELREFWLGELRDRPSGVLPRPRGIGSASRWSEVKLAIDPARHDALVALAGRAGAPVKYALLAAHLAVIGLLQHQSDVITAVFVNGRLEEESGEDVIGLFLNFMPFREELRGRTWRSLIAQVFASEGRRMPYRRYPFADLRRELRRGPLAETAFNYTQFKAYAEVAGDAGPTARLLGNVRWFEHTSFPLLVNAGYDLRLEQMIVTLNADARVLPQWSVELLAALYDATLTQMVRYDETPVTEPSGEMQRIAARVVGAR